MEKKNIKNKKKVKKKIGHNLKTLIKKMHEKSRKIPKKDDWIEQENV